jgi:predicted transcriptional regulator
MYSKKAKKMVAAQIIGMLANNVLNECGMESFMGWIEDGDAFYNVQNCENYTDAEISEAIELAKEISSEIDSISWELAPENEPDEDFI